MPLLDHFTPPVILPRRWESFRTYWAAAIGIGLNRILPTRYFATLNIQNGGQVEAEVAENASPTTTLDATYPDEVEIPIIDRHEDDRLAAAIELVSPSNKHDPTTRRAFATKCAAYLAEGVGLVVVDPVLILQCNLHDELVALLGRPASARMQPGSWMYSAAYRPVRGDNQNLIDVWTARVQINAVLPTMPLYLKGWQTVPLDLEETYTEVCQQCRLI